MHFRERPNVIQVIRMVYDSDTMRGKQVLIGTIPKKSLQMSAELHDLCSESERCEIQAWIDRYKEFQLFELTYVAKKIPANLQMAQEWFRINSESDDAKALAEEMLVCFREMKTFFKKKGLV